VCQAYNRQKRISVPTIPSLDYSNRFHAEKVVEELGQYKNCRIGLVGMGFISATFYNYIMKHLTSAKFEEATDMVDDIKAIKSDEEIRYIKETCELQDAVFAYVLTRIRPGRTEWEVFTDVKQKCAQMGAEGVNVLGGSAQPGTAVRMMTPYFGNKMIEDGDQFNLLIESNGPSGFWGELLRIVCLGKVTTELKEQFEICREAQKVTLDLLKPGVEPAAIWDANNEFLRSKGYPEETRIYAHGMGYDMVERPSITHDETMKIQARMNIAVHPSVLSAKASGQVCENYIISEAGEKICLHKTPQKIFTV
jgi:Xaa-Pro aminopeptidase